jgi:quinol monooxygenase YgiN
MIGIIATLKSKYITTLSDICIKHIKRQVRLEDGCSRCEMLISGYGIKLIEQWYTEQDYEDHKISENLKLFKKTIEPLIDSIEIEYFGEILSFPGE